MHTISKKIFSFLIIAFIVLSGSVIMPSDTNALSYVATPDCRVEGIVVEGVFQANQPDDPYLPGSGRADRYQMLIHITGSELLGDSQHGNCSDFYKEGYNKKFVFPTSILSAGMTMGSMLGNDISFKKGRYGELSSDIVFTPRPEQDDFCTIEAELISNPAQAFCMPAVGGSSCYGFTSLDFKVTKVASSITGQCSQKFPIGIIGATSLKSTNTLEEQGLIFEKGSKIRLLGSLNIENSRFQAFKGLVIASPEKELEPKPKPEEPKKDQEEKEEKVTGDNDEPIILNQQYQQNTGFAYGIIAGLFLGLIALVVVLLLKRNKK